MAREVIFHRLVQRDMTSIQRYYRDEASDEVADRFYFAFLDLVEKALERPQRFHPLHSDLRRANISGFPYHFLYRETSFGIRVLVLRHDKRHPSFGLSRK
ncbi:MAG: type II toxin-antitoxin system RelE/ParE family toxin [Verrucomicrobiales bacterium]|nr:type II toxin-antitoxin system RelE/ParE family toxin [Verrucomicrobiales bacterium]